MFFNLFLYSFCEIVKGLGEGLPLVVIVKGCEYATSSNTMRGETDEID